jgi:hypothetical protein
MTFEQERASEDVLKKLAEYAKGRASDVARGAETPELAALLLQKYGYGLCDAFALCFPESQDRPSYGDVDAAVAVIDPEWQTSAKRRWAARPAGLAGTAS